MVIYFSSFFYLCLEVSCLPERFKNKIQNQFYCYKMTCVNSKQKQMNSKGHFVLKNRFLTLSLKGVDILYYYALYKLILNFRFKKRLKILFWIIFQVIILGLLWRQNTWISIQSKQRRVHHFHRGQIWFLGRRAPILI